MAGKIGVITALGPVTGLTWRESLVTGAFLAQGGEFAFVIFGQATSGGAGSLFPQNLDELLVVVVIASMALTPLAVDLAIKIAGPSLDLSSLSDAPEDQLLTTVDEGDFFDSGSWDVSSADSADFVNLADLTTDLREADGKASVTSPASDSCDWAEGSEEAEACEVAMDIDAQRQSPRAKRAGADVETGIEVK
jgi:hypothetical protein